MGAAINIVVYKSKPKAFDEKTRADEGGSH